MKHYEKIQPSESITFNSENMEHDRTCKESKNSLGEHDVTLEVLPCGDSSPDLVDSIDATGIFLSQHHQANAERKKKSVGRWSRKQFFFFYCKCNFTARVIKCLRFSDVKSNCAGTRIVFSTR